MDKYSEDFYNGTISDLLEIISVLRNRIANIEKELMDIKQKD